MCDSAGAVRRAAIAVAIVVAASPLSRPAAVQVRDNVNAPGSGSATVRGRVVLHESGEPLRHAIVTATNGKQQWRAVTDDAGGFAIAGVQPGRVSIVASKPGYISGAYRATQPGRPGVPAAIDARDTLDVILRVGRGAVISGAIRDRHGEPIAGLLVFPIKAAIDPREIRRTVLVPRLPGVQALPTGVETDDRGEYRLFGLAPGEYLVMAAPQDVTQSREIVRRPSSEVDEILNRLRQRRPAAAPANERGAPASATRQHAFAPVFYPGTALYGEAAKIALGWGEERPGVDFVLSAVPIGRIEGVLVTPAGGPPEASQVSINPLDAIQPFALGSAMPTLAQAPDADGRFVVANVPPGRVRIVARARGNLYGAEILVIGDAPVTQVTMALRPGARVRGRVVVDSSSGLATPDPSDFGVVVSPMPVPSGTSGAGGAVVGSEFVTDLTLPVEKDGTFRHESVASARYRISIATSSDSGTRWWLRSATLHGRGDVLDAFDVALDEDIDGLVLTITDRPSSLAGTLQIAEGIPAPDYYVVVFPGDRALWSRASRHIRATRPAMDGSFRFDDLPGGSYLLAALTDAEPGEWERQDFLAAIAPAAVTVKVVDGKHTRQDLRIQR